VSAWVDDQAEEDCRWDLVSLGEVMVRFDPGDGALRRRDPLKCARRRGIQVARGLKRCFGLTPAVVTAFADDPVGGSSGSHLPGGVDQSLVRWWNTMAWPRGAQRPQFYGARFGVRPALELRSGHTASPVERPISIGIRFLESRARAGSYRRHLLCL